MGPDDRNFTCIAAGYPQAKNAVRSARADLTTRGRASSNTALLSDRSDGNEADLSTLEDSPCATPWLSRAQSHARRTQGTAQPSRSRPAPARAIAVVGPAKKRLGFDGSRRLGRKAEFERLLRGGARRTLEGFVFYYTRRTPGPARLGILISRKHAASAVQRNRIKRCIREAFRLEQPFLGSMEVLVRPPYGMRASPAMLRKVRTLLVQLP